jgi:hypothetical protein
MHFCTARIAIGGDVGNVRMRDRFDPVSWPELELIRALHSDESVQDVQPFVKVRQAPRAERERLLHIYGENILQHVWGGTRPPHEMDSPAGEADIEGPWFNPLSFSIETVEPVVEPPFNPPDDMPPPIDKQKLTSGTAKR